MTRSSKIVYRAPLGGHTLYASGHQPWSAQVERQLYMLGEVQIYQVTEKQQEVKWEGKDFKLPEIIRYIGT